MPVMSFLMKFFGLLNPNSTTDSVNPLFKLVLVIASSFWVACILAAAIYSAYSFSIGNFTTVFPLKFLRATARLTTAVLFIPLASLLVSVYRCKAGETWASSDLRCFGIQHGPLVAVVSILLPFFCIFSLCVSAVFFNRDYRSPSVIARAHGRVGVMMIVIKASLTFMFNAGGDAEPWILHIVVIALGALWLWMWLHFLPHFTQWYNQAWSAFGAVFLWAGLCGALAKILDDPEAGVGGYVFFIGIPSAAYTGYALAYMRFASFARIGTPGGRPLRTPYEVELRARYLLRDVLTAARKGRGTAVKPIDLSSIGNLEDAILDQRKQFAEGIDEDMIAYGTAFRNQEYASEVDSEPEETEGDAIQSTLQRNTMKNRGTGRSILAVTNTTRSKKSATMRSVDPNATSTGLQGPFGMLAETRSLQTLVRSTNLNSENKEEEKTDDALKQSRRLQNKAAADAFKNKNALTPLEEAKIISSVATLYQEASVAFPNSAILAMFHSQFIRCFVADREMELDIIAHGLNNDPAVDIRFLLFQSQRQIEESETAEANADRDGEEKSKLIKKPVSGGVAKMTIIERVQFDKTLSESNEQAMRARQTEHRFWKELRDPNPNLSLLHTLAEEMSDAVANATSAFEKLLIMASDSVEVLQSYAVFLLEVKRDVTAANMYFDAADELIAQQEALRNATQVSSEADLNRQSQSFIGNSSIGRSDSRTNPSLQGAISDYNMQKSPSLLSPAPGGSAELTPSGSRNQLAAAPNDSVTSSLRLNLQPPSVGKPSMRSNPTVSTTPIPGLAVDSRRPKLAESLLNSGGKLETHASFDGPNLQSGFGNPATPTPYGGKTPLTPTIRRVDSNPSAETANVLDKNRKGTTGFAVYAAALSRARQNASNPNTPKPLGSPGISDGGPQSVSRRSRTVSQGHFRSKKREHSSPSPTGFTSRDKIRHASESRSHSTSRKRDKSNKDSRKQSKSRNRLDGHADGHYGHSSEDPFGHNERPHSKVSQQLDTYRPFDPLQQNATAGHYSKGVFDPRALPPHYDEMYRPSTQESHSGRPLIRRNSFVAEPAQAAAQMLGPRRGSMESVQSLTDIRQRRHSLIQLELERKERQDAEKAKKLAKISEDAKAEAKRRKDNAAEAAAQTVRLTIKQKSAVKEPTLVILLKVITIFFLLSAALNITGAIVQRVLYRNFQSTIELAGSASFRQLLVEDSIHYVKKLTLYTSHQLPDTPTFDRANETISQLFSTASAFEDVHRNLYLHSTNEIEESTLYNTNSLKVKDIGTQIVAGKEVAVVVGERPVSLSNVGIEYAARLALVASLGPENKIAPHNPNVAYVLINGPEVLRMGMNRSSLLFETRAKAQADLLHNLEFSVMVAACGLFGIVSLLAVFPIVLAVRAGTDGIFSIFLNLPQQVLKEMEQVCAKQINTLVKLQEGGANAYEMVQIIEDGLNTPLPEEGDIEQGTSTSVATATDSDATSTVSVDAFSLNPTRVGSYSSFQYPAGIAHSRSGENTMSNFPSEANNLLISSDPQSHLRSSINSRTNALERSLPSVVSTTIRDLNPKHVHPDAIHEVTSESHLLLGNYDTLGAQSSISKASSAQLSTKGFVPTAGPPIAQIPPGGRTILTAQSALYSIPTTRPSSAMSKKDRIAEAAAEAAMRIARQQAIIPSGSVSQRPSSAASSVLELLGPPERGAHMIKQVSHALGAKKERRLSITKYYDPLGSRTGAFEQPSQPRRSSISEFFGIAKSSRTHSNDSLSSMDSLPQLPSKRFKTSHFMTLRLLLRFTWPIVFLIIYYVGVWAYQGETTDKIALMTRNSIYFGQVATLLSISNRELYDVLSDPVASCDLDSIGYALDVTESLTATINSNQDTLLFGNIEMGLPSAMRTAPELESIMLEDACTGIPNMPEDCATREGFYQGLLGGGLQAALREYLLLTRHVLLVRRDILQRTVEIGDPCPTVNLTDSDLVNLDVGAFIYLRSVFNHVGDIIDQLALDTYDSFVLGHGILAGLSIIVLIALYYFFFIQSLRKMDRDIKRTRSTLLMFPSDVLAGVAAFILLDKDDDDDYIEDDNSVEDYYAQAEAAISKSSTNYSRKSATPKSQPRRSHDAPRKYKKNQVHPY